RRRYGGSTPAWRAGRRPGRCSADPLSGRRLVLRTLVALRVVAGRVAVGRVVAGWVAVGQVAVGQVAEVAQVELGPGEPVRVGEVLVAGQQVGVAPEGVPATDAPVLGKGRPERGGLA